jgi:hypothetical protein
MGDQMLEPPLPWSWLPLIGLRSPLQDQPGGLENLKVLNAQQG